MTEKIAVPTSSPSHRLWGALCAARPYSQHGGSCLTPQTLLPHTPQPLLAGMPAPDTVGRSPGTEGPDLSAFPLTFLS